MNYSIVRLQGIPSSAVQDIYLRHPGIEEKSYDVQHSTILDDFSVFTGGFSREMTTLGNSSVELLYDCTHLQKTWARERGIVPNQESWQTQILLEQLKALKPDVVFFQDIFSLPEIIRNNIKNIVPSVKVVVIQKGFPGETRDLSGSDLLFVSSPVLMKRYKSLKPHLIYHSFDPRVYELVRKQKSSADSLRGLVFAGSTRMPEFRFWALWELLRKTRIEIWTNEDKERHKKLGGLRNWRNQKRLLRRIRDNFAAGMTQINSDDLPTKAVIEIETKTIKTVDHTLASKSSYGLIPKKTLGDMYPQRVHKAVYGFEYYRLLDEAGLVFNMHASSAGSTVDNMKMFEVTGMGTCLITDGGCNMSDIFDVDYEVVTYTSLDEVIEKSDYLLNNEAARRAIAEAGWNRVHREHTIAKRCEMMDELIREKLARSVSS